MHRFSLLHLACGLGLEDVVEFFLSEKFKTNVNDAENAEGLAPLHAAAMAGSPGCIEILLENGETGIKS
jgi:ankyrin repeat protein